MNLPNSIECCPILEALVEIRFTTEINKNAVFGILYSNLQAEFPKVETLPILQIPEQLRSIDPAFKYKPYFKITNDKYIVQIGPDVLSIAVTNNYQGWSDLSNTVNSVIECVLNTKIITKIERVGLRYINFFNNDIFNQIKIKISLKDKEIEYKGTVLKTIINEGDFTNSIQISNDAVVNNSRGSIIDIDTSISENLVDFQNNAKRIINQAHNIEKKLFFSILNDDFLTQLKPRY